MMFKSIFENKIEQENMKNQVNENSLDDLNTRENMTSFNSNKSLNEEFFSMPQIIQVFVQLRLKVKNTKITRNYLNIELYKVLSDDTINKLQNKLLDFDVSYSNLIVTLKIK